MRWLCRFSSQGLSLQGTNLRTYSVFPKANLESRPLPVASIYELYPTIRSECLVWGTFQTYLGLQLLLLFNSPIWVYTVILCQTKCQGNIVWLDQNKTTWKLFWTEMNPFQLAFLLISFGFTQHVFPMQGKYITWGSSGSCNQLYSKPFLHKCITVNPVTVPYKTCVFGTTYAHLIDVHTSS